MHRWKDGVVRGPDGPARQIPQRTPLWASALYVTKDGAVRRRHYNPITREWHWSDESTELTLSDSGSLGLVVDHWITLELAIALAWLPRVPESPSRVTVRRDTIDAAHIAWQEPEAVGDEAAVLRGERWRPLRWRVGAITCDGGYEISTKGRLRNARGDVTSGYWFDGRRWAACRECVLVDLTTAAGLREDVVTVPPSIKQAVDALLTGRSVQELAAAARVSPSTAWSYVCRACQLLSRAERMAIGPQLVTGEVWRVLSALARERDERLGGPLLELLPVVERRLSKSSECNCFRRSEFKMSQLRLARLCMVDA